MDSAVLAKEALKLSVVERAHLIDELWRSLDPAEQAEVDRAWLEESRDRLNAFRAGTLKDEDGETALRAIEAELGR